MSAAHHALDNLCAVIDRNSLQIDGSTEKVMSLEPLAEKWKSFGWNVISCDGHDFKEILTSFNKGISCKGKPTVIIARTIMGKGISSIEGDYRWHGKAPTLEQSVKFIGEIG